VGKFLIIWPLNRPPRLGGGVEVELYSFFDLGPRWEWVVNATPRPLYPRERDVIFAAHNVPFQFCAEDNKNIFATASYCCVIFSCLFTHVVGQKASKRACKFAGLILVSVVWRMYAKTCVEN
jgi:hypothetical protein